MKQNDFSWYLTDYFTKYLFHEVGASLNTIQSYKDTFVLFIQYLNKIHGYKAENICLKDFTKEIIIQFLDWIERERNCSVSSRNQRLTAIKSFIRYVQYQDPVYIFNFQQVLSIRLKKGSKKAISYLSVEGIELLLKQPDLHVAKGRRDLALLALMYDTGGRVQELIDLTPGAIRFDKYSTVCINGKGRKIRSVPLLENNIKILKNYLEEHALLRPEYQSKPLFFNSRGEKFTRAGISNILKRHIIKAKEECIELIPQNISPHSLRHSKAMHLLQAGVNLVYIRDFLGHSSITTTEIYARADNKQKREALEKAHRSLTPQVEPIWLVNKNLLDWLKNL